MATATKLTNLQQELLKVFSVDISDKELIEVKELLVKYFAEKAMDEADKIWDKRGYNNELMDKWVNDPNQ